MLPSPDTLEGRPVPRVTFKARADNQWHDITSDELFKDKTVVVFALPGAYTPTCSSTSATSASASGRGAIRCSSATA
jgi:peroxiredoxin